MGRPMNPAKTESEIIEQLIRAKKAQRERLSQEITSLEKIRAGLHDPRQLKLKTDTREK